MARRSFRDRFFTPPVAKAMASPLGLVLAVAGGAAGFFLGGIPAAVALAAAAWGGRVVAAVPRNEPATRIDPFALGEPWKRMVQDAVQAQNRYRDAMRGVAGGPLQERLAEIGDKIAHGVEEAWRVGQAGQAVSEARRRIDSRRLERDVARMTESGPPEPGSSEHKILESFQAQLASAARLDATVGQAREQLRLTTARLDEAVARAAELSAHAGDAHDLTGLDDDVDALVLDLEALRQGLEAVNRPATGTGTT